MKERPIIFSAEMIRALLDGRKTQTRRVIKQTKKPDLALTPSNICTKKMVNKFWYCPYGIPGDRLWVRETWSKLLNFQDARNPVPFAVYKSTFKPEPHFPTLSWDSPRYMPRWASRITLEITDVMVERVQDISHDNAIVEGMEANNDDGAIYYGPLGRGHADPRMAFKWLWDSINGNKYPWKSNPWIWAITFRRINT